MRAVKMVAMRAASKADWKAGLWVAKLAELWVEKLAELWVGKSADLRVRE